MSDWLYLQDEQATLAQGASLWPLLKSRCPLVWLRGDLGAGKTTLVRGILRAAGHQGAVRSPTYTLLEPYDLQPPVYHFDLYRLQHPDELEFVGGREYLGEGSVRLVEWPEKARGWLPAPDLIIELQVVGKARQIHLEWQNSQA